MVGWIKMKLGMQVGLGPGHIVLDWDSDELPLPQKGAKPPPNFRPISVVAKWLDGSRCHLVGLNQSDIVLAGDPAPPPQKESRAPPIFGHVYCGQAAGWIKMPLGMEVSLGPGHIVLDGDPAPPPKVAQAPSFWPISVVAKWLHGSRCHLAGR